MTSSIPNSFSKDDLERMLENAPADPTPEFDRDDTSEKRLKALAEEVEDFIQERVSGPLGPKVCAFLILGHLMAFHTEVGKERFANGEPESGVSWLRDAGKLQAAMGLLQEIDLGDDDFISRGSEVD